MRGDQEKPLGQVDEFDGYKFHRVSFLNTHTGLCHNGFPPRPSRDGHMVPDFSEELLGKIFSVGVRAGLPIPELLLLLDRCWTIGRAGLTGGGLSWAPARRADNAGLKVVSISVLEELLLLMAASGSRIMMVCRGLTGSEFGVPRVGFFIGSRVSRTTSGACLAVF